jgi:hypothetical protein
MKTPSISILKARAGSRERQKLRLKVRKLPKGWILADAARAGSRASAVTHA